MRFNKKKIRLLVNYFIIVLLNKAVILNYSSNSLFAIFYTIFFILTNYLN